MANAGRAPYNVVPLVPLVWEMREVVCLDRRVLNMLSIIFPIVCVSLWQKIMRIRLFFISLKNSHMHSREPYLKIWRELAIDKTMVFLAGPRQAGYLSEGRRLPGGAVFSLSLVAVYTGGTR